MPNRTRRTRRRRRPTRATRRRRYTRRTKTRGAYGKVAKSFPLGRKFKTQLRYAEIDLTLDPGTAGAAAQYVFSANGLYDPNITGTGHQPLGFDQMMAMYDHYVVIGSQIQCVFQNTDGARAQNVSIHLQDNATTSTDYRILLENGNCVYTTLGPATSGTDTKGLTLKCNPNKFLSRSKPLSDPDLKGTDSANPTEQCYFVVTAAPQDAYDTQQVFFQAVIQYTVVFIEPVQLALS